MNHISNQSFLWRKHGIHYNKANKRIYSNKNNTPTINLVNERTVDVYNYYGDDEPNVSTKNKKNRQKKK